MRGFVTRAVSSIAPATTAQPAFDPSAALAASATRAAVVYDRGTNRWHTCGKIGGVSGAIGERRPAARIPVGEEEHRTVHCDLPENRHIGTESSLVSQSLIFETRSEGRGVRWATLDTVRRLAGNEDALTERVVESLDACLVDQ